MTGARSSAPVLAGLAVLVLSACSESPTTPEFDSPSYALVSSTGWSASGPGAVTVVDDGSTADPSMTYALHGSAVYSTQTWRFSTTATSSGTVTVPYAYSGFHAWFNVRVFLRAYITTSSGTTTYALASQGPANCCSPPSGGFNITGSHNFTVAAGDTYGFEFGGSNGDSDARLLGTFTIPWPVPSDVTPPVITPTITGTLGNDNWYTSDVEISWDVSDDESAITSPACTATLVDTDTPEQTASCSATSAGGTADAEVTVKRDATAPVIGYTGNTGAYTVDQNIAIDCDASDAQSGLASDTCVDVNAPAYTLSLGGHNLSADAEDNAGNTNTASTAFTVSATDASVCALVKSWVTNRGVANSLCVKLGQKSSRSFVNEVNAQTGKHVPADKAPILIGLAVALLDS